MKEIDKKEMMNEIKVTNRKTNFITLLIILCFLGYFALSYGYNRQWLKQIEIDATYHNYLYSEKFNLELA